MNASKLIPQEVHETFRAARTIFMWSVDRVEKVRQAIENHQPTQRAIEVFGTTAIASITTALVAEAAFGSVYLAYKLPATGLKIAFGASAALMTWATVKLSKDAVREIKNVCTHKPQQLNLF